MMTEQERQANLRQYEKLSDTPIGNQSRSKAQIKKDAAKTTRFIIAHQEKTKKAETKAKSR